MSRRKIKRSSEKQRRPRGQHARQATPGQLMELEMRRNRKTAALKRRTAELQKRIDEAKAAEKEDG